LAQVDRTDKHGKRKQIDDRTLKSDVDERERERERESAGERVMLRMSTAVQGDLSSWAEVEVMIAVGLEKVDLIALL
jgi:urease accessory protein UreE